MRIKVSKDYDAIFGSGGIALRVSFYFGDSHGWEWATEDLLHILIFLFGDILPCLGVVMETKIFLAVRVIPDLFVFG